MTLNPSKNQRKRLLLTGVVQGVGFRPFVYRLAYEHDLKGFVMNSSQGLIIEAEGDEALLSAFIQEIRAKAPPLAEIDAVTIQEIEETGDLGFVIKESLGEEAKSTLVSPDIATCGDCLTEIFDSKDRRYRYPFTNCTNCGPRFTLIEALPYDRAKTTMKDFKMCSACQAEYDDPFNRRFHAQPNACPICGPKLSLVKSGEMEEGPAKEMGPDDPITQAARLLKEGEILAIKSIGGFQLVCDAYNEAVVSELRLRKRRPAKPFAVMMATLDEVRESCLVSPKEEEILLSSRRPILLVSKEPTFKLAPSIAPAVDRLGVMLPYSPLHHLLLKEFGRPLVMTSGNLSEEPIAYRNLEALERLGTIADYFLLGDRAIHSRYDDSVVEVDGEGEVMVRRARGYAPSPIRLGYDSAPVLAVGGELKNAFALAKGGYAFVSQHFGDMDDMLTLAHFEQTLSLYKKLFVIEPELIACDLHPGYMTTKFAESLGGVDLTYVQHHHGHIASCLAENGLTGPVIGLAFDGSGLGLDGKIWGGEFLVADLTGFRRYGHLCEVPLPGGDGATKNPYRMAVSYLLTHFGPDLSGVKLDFLEDIDETELKNIKAQIAKGINTPLTSSMGRLFDAVAALTGTRLKVSYEGQAAIELEAIANPNLTGSYEFLITPKDEAGSIDPVWLVETGPIIEGVVNDIKKGETTAFISTKFHNSVADFSTAMAAMMAGETGISQVVLSGGVFQNRLLRNKLISRLKAIGLSAHFNKLVSTGDGGLSLGQAAIANFISKNK